jgi:hypothetical protein
MFELLAACGLLLSVIGLTLALRAFARRFSNATAYRAAIHAPAGNGIYGHNLVDTYLDYRQ